METRIFTKYTFSIRVKESGRCSDGYYIPEKDDNGNMIDTDEKVFQWVEEYTKRFNHLEIFCVRRITTMNTIIITPINKTKSTRDLIEEILNGPEVVNQQDRADRLTALFEMVLTEKQTTI